MPLPPPPPPGPPPPPSGLLAASPPPAVDPNSRNLLLESIRSKPKLRKATGVRDRSAPIVDGSKRPASQPDDRPGPKSYSSATMPRLNGMNLFIDGIPKLKPVNSSLHNSQSNSLSSLNHTNSNPSLANGGSTKSLTTVAREKRSDRGPPPQPPVSTLTNSISEMGISSNGRVGSGGVNTHSRTVSSISLHNGSKPTLAPKPPPLTNRPAPKPGVHRAHSMKAPASPSVFPTSPTPPFPPTAGGTLGPKKFHSSSDNVRERLKKPTTRPPPPPPPSLPPPPPPTKPPPPPLSTLPNFNNTPPEPPMRSTSITKVSFETRFADKFHSVREFPPPQPFRGVPKVYNSKTAKQPAPQPPSAAVIQLGQKMWARDTSSC